MPSAQIISFPRPLAHSHVLILTEREGKRVEPEVIARGSWEHCDALRWVERIMNPRARAICHILSASEFDALKEGH